MLSYNHTHQYNVEIPGFRVVPGGKIEQEGMRMAVLGTKSRHT